MKVFLISPEITPFAETGITGQFSRNFPVQLQEDKHDIRLIMPKYPFISDRKYTLREVIRLREIPVEWNSDSRIANIKSGFVPDSKVQVYFLGEEHFFDSVDERIYKAKGARKALEDTDIRFAFFSKASLESLKYLHWQPDIIHCCGWSTAFIPIMLRTLFKDDPFYKEIKVVFTLFSSKEISLFSENSLNLAKVDTGTEGENLLSFDKKRNFSPILAGMNYSDYVTTLSSANSDPAKDLKSNPIFAKAIKDKKDKFKTIAARSDSVEAYNKITASILDVYNSLV